MVNSRERDERYAIARASPRLSRADRAISSTMGPRKGRARSRETRETREPRGVVEASTRARGGERGEEETTMLEIQRAVFEALSAMRETQQRMNGKLSWISRSLPKIYDAVGRRDGGDR